MYALVFYGYTNDCPSHMSMSCSTCPTYCMTCDVASTFHCAECNPGFSLSVDQQSCSCPSPLQILNDLCGDFPVGCTVVQMLSDMSLVCVECDISKQL